VVADSKNHAHSIFGGPWGRREHTARPHTHTHTHTHTHRTRIILSRTLAHLVQNTIHYCTVCGNNGVLAEMPIQLYVTKTQDNKFKTAADRTQRTQTGQPYPQSLMNQKAWCQMVQPDQKEGLKIYHNRHGHMVLHEPQLDLIRHGAFVKNRNLLPFFAKRVKRFPLAPSSKACNMP
jgi:hypothetical protein